MELALKQRTLVERLQAGEVLAADGATGTNYQRTGIEIGEPLGEMTHQQAVDAYAEQAAALTEGGVDFLLLETLFALEEGTAAIEGVTKVSGLPLVVSFSYDQGTRTMMGLRPAQVAAAIA